MLVLAGDIGGTHTRLALVAVDDGGAEIDRLEVYPSREHDSLEEIVAEFTGRSGPTVETACFGVAGPVRNGVVRTTNLPWTLRAGQLSDSLGVPTAVINDLEAIAWSVPLLGRGRLDLLHEGDEDEKGNGAVLAPGTGLGQAGLYRDGSRLRPFATEGGHADFAPSDEAERELQAELVERHGHASWERVLSGPGLVTMHRFLSLRPGSEAPTCGVQAGDGGDDAPVEITRNAATGGCPVCAETVRRFARLLGAQAGNLALTLMATAGVWIAGGIAPDIVEELRGGGFGDGFLTKGRMRHVVERIPVWVVLDEHAGLRGAARCAAQTARSG